MKNRLKKLISKFRLNTIFKKLIAVFTCVLLISSLITGIILYGFLGNFVLGEKIKLLERSAEEIAYLSKTYVQNQSSTSSYKMINDVIYLYGENTNSIIMIVNKDGYIVICNNTYIPEQALEKLQSEQGKLKLPDARQYTQDILSEDVLTNEIGDFYGLFSATNVSWLTIGKPLVYNGDVEGVILISTPVPEVHKARLAVLKFYLISMIVSIIISIGFIYIFSLKISRPLKKINKAAKSIATGDFTETIEVETDDEIGGLACSFNNMAVNLANLEKMRHAFVANVTHEIRTPITSIRGFIEGMLDGTIPTDKTSKYLEIVRDEVIRINKLVTELLDLARIESGEVEIKLSRVDINELLRRCIIKFEALIVQKDILVEANLETEYMYVIADMDSIERVILNLLHNAIKFTNEHGKIDIETTQMGERVKICIKNTGEGISKEDIDLIWDRFYKSDKSRSNGGTGLGLSIAKGIMNAHGEEIWINSEEGAWTEACFTLKLYRSQDR